MKYSQLRAMRAIMAASFRSMLRSPSAVLFTLFFPLIFIVVFGFIGRGSMKINIGFNPLSDKNNPVYFALIRTPNIRLEEETPREAAIDITKNNIDGFITIVSNPPDATARYRIELTTGSSAREGGTFLNLILNEITDKVNLQQAQISHPVVEIRQEEISTRTYSMIDFILPGQLGFAILSSGVFGTAFVFLSLRQTLVLKRFFATPIKRLYIVLGEASARMVFSLLGALILILIGHYAFHFTLVKGIITVFNMLVLSGLGMAIFMGFGFIISGIARNENSVPPLANIITLPQFLLSGTFFSIDVFPNWLQPIAHALPLTYLNDALRKIAYEGANFWDVRLQILILMAWGIVTYIAAAKTFRWE